MRAGFRLKILLNFSCAVCSFERSFDTPKTLFFPSHSPNHSRLSTGKESPDFDCNVRRCVSPPPEHISAKIFSTSSRSPGEYNTTICMPDNSSLLYPSVRVTALLL